MMAKTMFQVGELIENRHRVLSTIGSGGMGTLYRVADEAKGDKVIALKMIKLDTPMAGTESLERFRREFQVLTQLHHPNLVSVHDFGITTAGQLYFTMEWIEGSDLESNLRQVKPKDILPIMIQICRALAYLHARGVIHGDLKPGNVLLVGDQVKLVDFGVAIELRSPELRARYYTPGFSAPEIKLKRAVDQRIDLYSLGALWYALLTGEPPLFSPGPGRERLIRFTLDEALETRPEIPPALGSIATRLLANSAQDRYTSANEVIQVVNKVTGHEYELETRETASSYALRTHFVNRETEIELLQTAWKDSKNHKGKLVLVGGESGVGKTRLVTELEIQAELEGARVVWGQCVERGSDAYLPWREVLHVLTRYIEDGDEATMQQAGPVLATLLPELWNRDYLADVPPPAELDPQAAQLRLNNAIVQVLQVAGELRPTVVMIENAHWADEASLEMLRFLARVSGLSGLLTLVTYRDDEVDDEHLLETLTGEQVLRVQVHRLAPPVTSDLVRSMLGLEKLPLLLTERVQQTTGGNAFFVQELIRSLAVEGQVLRRTVEGWQVDGLALQKTQLPESIHQVVERRLGQLSPEARRLAEWAAVVGLVFWDGCVAQVGQTSQAKVRVALEELSNLGLVAMRDETSFAGEAEYLFYNPTVREVSYENVSEDEQKETHSRIAAWLIDRPEDEIDAHLGLIAEHLEQAEQVTQAVTYLRRAGEQAASRFANAEAVDFFSRALGLTPEDNLMERYALLLARENVYRLQGAREVQLQDLTALEELAEELDDKQQQAEVALRRAQYGDAMGDYPTAIAAAQAAIRLAQATQDVAGEAAGHIQWGKALQRQGEYGAARAQLEQALTLAQTAGLRELEADSLHNLGIITYYQGGHAKAMRYHEQALHIYREIGARLNEAGLLLNLGNTCSTRISGAEYYKQALQVCQEIGHRRTEGAVLGNLGNVSFIALADYANALNYYEQCMRICREVGDRRVKSIVLSFFALLLLQQYEQEIALDHSQQALRIAQETGNRDAEGYAFTSLGRVLETRGHLAEAVDAYQQAMDVRSEIGQHHMTLEPLAGLVRVYLQQGEPDQAQAQVEEILSFLDQGNTLESFSEPFLAYWTCYRALQANQDPRAEDLLNETHRLLQEWAARISDEEQRHSFLENVPYHREIRHEYATMFD